MTTEQGTKSANVDPSEIEKFGKLATRWWDPHSEFKPLHDLTDSARGIDEGNYFRTQYGAHVLEDGLLSRSGLWRYIALTGGLALFAFFQARKRNERFRYQTDRAFLASPVFGPLLKKVAVVPS